MSRQRAARRHLSHPSTLQPPPGKSVLFHPPHPNQQPASEQLGLNENEESISGHHTPVRFRTYSRADTEKAAGKSTHPPDLQVLLLLGERSTSTATPQKQTEETDSRREERLSLPQEPDRQTDGRTRSPSDPTWRWPQALRATAAAASPPAAPPRAASQGGGGAEEAAPRPRCLRAGSEGGASSEAGSRPAEGPCAAPCTQSQAQTPSGSPPGASLPSVTEVWGMGRACYTQRRCPPVVSPPLFLAQLGGCAEPGVGHQSVSPQVALPAGYGAGFPTSPIRKVCSICFLLRPHTECTDGSSSSANQVAEIGSELIIYR